jgi:hypothetical protein
MIDEMMTPPAVVELDGLSSGLPLFVLLYNLSNTLSGNPDCE